MKISQYFQQIQLKDKHLRSYYVLAVFRVFLVFVPQFGYIHPDEFFQSLEVMAGDEYGLEHTRTWEFNQTFPIRSIAIPYVSIKMPLNFLRFVAMYARYFFHIDLVTTYTLLVYPRLLMVALSFVNDWSMYRICKSYGLRYELRLVTLASSYVMLVFGSRTLSNTIEMSLCSILLFIVADCMVHTNTVIFQSEFLQEKYAAATSTVERVKLYKLESSLPRHSFNRCWLISTICVTGCFNRPTFLFFGVPMVFFWLMRGMGTRSTTFMDFNLRILSFVVTAIPALFAFILIDSLYYGYLSLAEIQHLQVTIDNFVVTPLNFVRYNIDPGNTAKHGIHPKYLHVLVNIPLLYNILGIVTICSFGLMVYRFCHAEYKDLPRAQSVVTLMTSSIVVPVLLLSLINHQEPRFLLPLTLPVIFLHAAKLENGFATKNPFSSQHRLCELVYKHVLSTKASAGYMLKYWFVINIVMTLFFGFIHQGGTVQLAKHMSAPLQAAQHTNVHTHLVTSHIYSIPMSLFFLPSTQTTLVNPETGQKYRRNKRLFLYEYGSMDMDQLYKKIKLILDVCEMKAAGGQQQRYQLLLAIPSSLSEDLSMAFWRSNTTLVKHERIKVFYPHLSTEALPKLFIRHPTEIRMDLFGGIVDHQQQKCGLYDQFAADEHPVQDHRWQMDQRQQQQQQQDQQLSVTMVLKQFSSIIHQFGLALYRIEVGHSRSFSQ